MFRFSFTDALKESTEAEGDGSGGDSTCVKTAVETPLRTDAVVDSENALTVELRSGLRFFIASGSQEERDLDLEPGVYEGGRKLWESSVDLVEFCAREAFEFTGKKVLELGCGHALPGIYAAHCGAREVVLLDFNEDVLRDVTQPNLSLNKCGGSESPTRFRLFSGDWSTLADVLEDGEKFDVILSAETVYDVSNLKSLASCIFNVLDFEAGGIALIAAKTYYFGVGGGTLKFQKAVEQHNKPSGKIVCETVDRIQDGNSNVREVMKVSLVQDG